MEKKVCEICKGEIDPEFGNLVEVKVRDGGVASFHLGCLLGNLEVKRDTRVTEVRTTYRNPDLD